MSDPTERSGLGEFFAEMSRRHVGRFALAYAATAFVLLQLVEIVFPAFGIGEGGVRLVVAVAALGFPPALIGAWMYDIGRTGVTRTGGGPGGPHLRAVALGSLLIVTVLVTGGAGLYLARQGVFATEAVQSRSPAPEIRAAAYDPSQPISSIAVLPLNDYSPSGDQAYFASSMHEELIAKLSQIEQIRVVSRTTVMRYQADSLTAPEIGRQLGVDVLVEGSITRTPERTRVTLQLIHAPSDSHIRTLQWDREDVEDVLAFQTEVAHELVEAVDTQHDETVFRTASSEIAPEAQESYIRGRYEYDRGTPEGYRMALQYFEEAVAQDPDFAQALAGMAGARFLGTLESGVPVEGELLRAYGEAEAAVDLDSTSVETREVFALIERNLPRLVGDAMAMAEQPSEGHVVTVMRMPGSADSIVIDTRALDSAWAAPLTSLGERIQTQVRSRLDMTDSQSVRRMVFDARQLLAAGRYHEAEAVLGSAVEASPDDAAAWDLLIRTQVSGGDDAGATDAARRWLAARPDHGLDESDVIALENALEASGADGYWRWRLAHLEEEEESGAPSSSFEVATAHAALGDDERALEYLVRALRDGEPGVMSVRTDPVWDDLRSDPRLREVVRQAQRVRLSPNRPPPRPPGGG
ncbi:MAG: hypothetical protein OEN56_06945 [Gemmatimonadota bacterium]|nr:hypothetical protein [Gemmatimonadota bacterium]